MCKGGGDLEVMMKALLVELRVPFNRPVAKTLAASFYIFLFR